MNRYVVTKNFKDQYTGRYYAIGSVYVTSDENRAADLERSGYIAPDNTETAAMAKQQAANAQGQNMQQQNEAYTVVDGQKVSLKAAQKAAEAVEANLNTTGLTEAHNNNSEPVQAGQMAKNQNTQAANNQGKPAAFRHTQSGQKEMAQNLNANVSHETLNANATGASALEQTQQAFEQTQLNNMAEVDTKATKAAAKAKKGE